MDIKRPFVKIDLQPEPEMDLFWENKNLRSISEIFPGWEDAHEHISDYINKMTEIEIELNREKMEIGPILPRFKFIDYIPTTVHLWTTFPQKHHSTFLDILHGCILDYIPKKVLDLVGAKSTDQTLYMAKSILEQHKQRILHCGGFSFKEDLAMRFGLRTFNGRIECILKE